MPNPRHTNSLRLSEFLKRDLFSISDQMQEIRYKENQQDYIWGKSMMRMLLEVQCVAMACIVTSQVWILTSYGSPVFERLVGDEIALPLLYLMSILMGTLTYAKPTYWRIAMSLTLYSVCVYFSILVCNMGVRILMAPGLVGAIQKEPENAGVWIPWAIGFALHMQICISSIIIVLISIRDMYTFNPQVVTQENEPDVVVSLPDTKLQPSSPEYQQYFQSNMTYSIYSSDSLAYI